MRLDTERLALREITSADFADVHAYGADPVVTEHEAWGPNDEGDTAAFIVSCAVRATASPRTHFTLGIAPKPGERLVGACSLWIESEEHRRGAFGYVLNPSVWGRGYATEAARALVGYGFGALGLHRLEATTRPENARSQRVLERLGMAREGLLREHVLVRGAWRDTLVYGLIAPG